MSAPDIVARPALHNTWRTVPRVGIWIAVGTLILGIAFHEEITAALAVWSSSTAYNHCFLVGPIAAYLIWDRRESLRGLRPVPMPAIAFAGVPVAVAWFAAERLGIMEGRQLAAVTFVELLFLAVLGWRLSWAMAGPLLYLYFLVPFGEFLTPQLQDFTTWFVKAGLHLLNIPVYIDGYTIEIPQGSFYIAEACAGLRFLIASIAFGALYSLVMYRSPPRRTVFLLASLVVPVIANGFRALGIVVLGNLLGSAQAAATDHVLYGWLFFSIVILVLIVLGLPFREDQHRVEVTRRIQPGTNLPQPRILRRGVFAAAVVCLIAIISPAVALTLQPAARAMPAALGALDFGPVCSPATTRQAAPVDGGNVASRRVNCGGLTLQVRMSVLSPHVTAASLFGVERQMISRMQSEDGFQTSWVAAGAGQTRTWRLLQSIDISKVMAVAMWVDGKSTQPGLSDRIRMAWTSLPGASVAPVVITVTPEMDWSNLGEVARHDMLHRFIGVLQSWPDMTRQVKRIAGHA